MPPLPWVKAWEMRTLAKGEKLVWLAPDPETAKAELWALVSWKAWLPMDENTKPAAGVILVPPVSSGSAACTAPAHSLTSLEVTETPKPAARSKSSLPWA